MKKIKFLALMAQVLVLEVLVLGPVFYYLIFVMKP